MPFRHEARIRSRTNPTMVVMQAVRARGSGRARQSACFCRRSCRSVFAARGRAGWSAARGPRAGDALHRLGDRTGAEYSELVEAKRSGERNEAEGLEAWAVRAPAAAGDWRSMKRKDRRGPMRSAQAEPGRSLMRSPSVARRSSSPGRNCRSGVS